MQYPDPDRSPASLPVPAGAAARDLRDGLLAALGADLRALYLYGALTFAETAGLLGPVPGGDLDYHAILAGPPDAGQRAAVAAHETELARRHPGYGNELDGWFILLADARRADPPRHLLQPGLRDFSWALHRAHWLAGQCVVLHGPDPAQIVPLPGDQELIMALKFELDFAARDPSDAFAVLNACRIIHSVAAGDVVQSKAGSAAWALANLRAEHRPAIIAALDSYRGEATPAGRREMAAGRPALITLAARELGC